MKMSDIILSSEPTDLMDFLSSFGTCLCPSSYYKFCFEMASKVLAKTQAGKVVGFIPGRTAATQMDNLEQHQRYMKMKKDRGGRFTFGRVPRMSTLWNT